MDQLREDDLLEVREFIEDLRAAAEADDEPLHPETLESLDRGLADIQAGRVKPLEQYERERGL